MVTESSIIENKEKLLQASECPLLSFHHLDNNFIYTEVVSEHRLDPYSNFSRVTIDDIIHLRVLIYLSKIGDSDAVWIMKLLRYIEIRYATIPNREKESKRSSNESTALFHQIHALFAEYHVYTQDIIYLNTALKVQDLRWLNNKTGWNIALQTLYHISSKLIERSLQNIHHE